MTDRDPPLPQNVPALGTPIAALLKQAVSSVNVILHHSISDRHDRNLCIAIHDLRVTLRRLNVAAGVFADLLPSHVGRKLKRRTKKLRRSAGELRDIDVMMETLHLLTRHSGSTDADFQACLGTLQKQRPRALNGLRKKLQRPKCHQLWSWIDEHVVAELNACKITPNELQRLAAREVHTRLQAFRHAENTARDNHSAAHLHALRIQAKRLRYTIELFDSYAVAVPGSGMRDAAKAWQNRLGKVQDLTVLATHLADPLNCWR